MALDEHGRRLIVEAAVLVALVWTGLRLLPFHQLRRLLDRYAGPRQLSPPQTTALDRIPWAVDAAANRCIFPATCLVRALVADAMLRRRGFATQLRVGVRLCGERTSRVLEAHAWLECNDRVIIGDLADIREYVVPAASHGL
jgi:hypothetical protein